MEGTTLLWAEICEEVTADWGRLTWYASGKLGNSGHMTLGLCVIRPGRSNPHHSHPNCVEILRVAQGRIMHTVENGEIGMRVGDVITIPANFPHHARNVGDTDAVREVAFSSPDRQVKGE